jgi:hypothetical protein
MLGQDTREGRANETCMARRVALTLSEWNWEGWDGLHAWNWNWTWAGKRTKLGAAYWFLDDLL